MEAADHILTSWRAYTDKDAFIFSETDGVPPNTITPIARMRDGKYELDLVLRNNITTKEAPWGVYHPSADLHHIKKENIGLIEVMGLAVLPARLKDELTLLEKCLINEADINDYESLEKHKDWFEEIKNQEWTKDNVKDQLQYELTKVFVRVLEDAGVFKLDEKGKKYFIEFIEEAIEGEE